SQRRQNLAQQGRFIYSMPDTLSPNSYNTTSPYMPGYQVIVAGLLALGMSTEAALYGVTCLACWRLPCSPSPQVGGSLAAWSRASSPPSGR
ncbi:MAG: hypothetical protein HC853_15400, partial [Anaerolineae bacterium]|nr:hypothetical protein [Anaerolineae bacterium]